LTDVHAARSRLGITIPKVKAIKEQILLPAERTKDEIEAEIFKVGRAYSAAQKKIKRCNERLDQLMKELEAAE
ncbi:MAG: hypothetical protein PHF25_09475, partial [Candidatus Margulisbacteria bacterium]|nr:hypothetical protein [Candidatus Margulisiibacteriota bacterium]